MLKKGAIVGAALLLIVGLLFGRSGWSYLSTSVGRIQQTVKDNVPVEFELERARNEIGKLDSVIRELMHEIAKEEVKVDKLESQVASAQQNLADSKEDIMTLKEALDSGDATFRFAGHRYTAKDVEQDLARRFEAFKTKDATTDKLNQILEARQKRLGAAHEELKETMGAKKQLEVEVANLEAQHKMIQVAKTASKFNFDDSQLARTRELVEDIRTRLQVDAKMVDAESEFQPEIQLDDPASSDDISEEVAEYFGEPEANDYAGLK